MALTNLNIESINSSTELQAELAKLGLLVAQYDGFLHVDGTDEEIAAGRVFVENYDIVAGVFKDVAKIFQAAVQKHLDAEAQTLGYDNILSACSYAGYANPYQAEGQSFIAWRGSVWDYCYTQLAGVQSGSRTRPDIDAFILELPTRA